MSTSVDGNELDDPKIILHVGVKRANDRLLAGDNPNLSSFALLERIPNVFISCE